MQSPESQKIVIRFFGALQYLIDTGKLKNRNTYYKKYGLIQSHLWRMEKDPSSKIFEMAWMVPLVIDYGISAHWLLTGEGSIKRTRVKNIRPASGTPIPGKAK